MVHINHEVTVALDYRFAYRTNINGKLKILNTTFGHNLGAVEGSGTLYLESPLMPAGRFDDFFACSNNATLELVVPEIIISLLICFQVFQILNCLAQKPLLAQ